MTGHSEIKKDVLLAAAYWSTFALAILALVLSVLLLMISSKALAFTPVWAILRPYVVAAVPWLYLDILTRAYRGSAPQRSRLWMLLLSFAGLTTLGLIARSLLDTPHGFDPGHLIIWGPWFAGCLSFCAVIRILLRTG